MSSVINHELEKLKSAYADAMWAWAEVESWLFVIFHDAHDGKKESYEYLRETYFAVVSFDLRLTMTNNVAKMRWSNSRIIDYWSDIYKACKKENGKRGKIAHLVGSVFMDGALDMQALMTVPDFHPRRPSSLAIAKVEGYSAATLSKFASDWHALSIRIAKLANLAVPLEQR